MANFTHYTRGSCASITQHNERKKNDKGEYLKYKNESIDTSRTHLNYNLAPQREQTQLEFIRERTESLKCLKRKDVNVMASWLVTAPKTLPEEHQREFFERSYQFLENKYGKANVISAYVHMDETTPHMHFCFVPVVFDHKKQREKVSCKECVTKYDLQKFHPDLQQNLDEWREQKGYEFECDIMNGATANGNLTIEQLKARTLEEMNENEEAILDELIDRTNTESSILQNLSIDVENLSEERQSLSEERERLSKDISKLKAIESALEKNIAVLEGKRDVLNTDRTTLLERFVGTAKIKPIFEQFCKNATERQEKEKEERTERKSVVGTLEYYKEQIERNRQSSSFTAQKTPKSHYHGDRER